MFDDMLILKLKSVGLRVMMMHTRKSGEVKWRQIDLGTKGSTTLASLQFHIGAKNVWNL